MQRPLIEPLFILSRYHSYLNSAAVILTAYTGNEPFASYLKKYFSQQKKFGSKDRKQVGHLCYCYFRLGKALVGKPFDEKVLIALFLCSQQPTEILQELKPEWNENFALSFYDKQKLIGAEFSLNEIFAWQNILSETIEKEEFILSHLQQPNFFLRLRPGKEEVVKQKLIAAGIPFQIISNSCFALPNASKIDELIAIDKEAVIQDFSSQRVGDFMESVNPELIRRRQSYEFRVWDCCAASGGKSILAKDVLGKINLTVSDVRESILVNLSKRFAKAGINKYESFIADLSKQEINKNTESFDLIITDVPCSGSGTWSRTPEQLYYFATEKIEKYAALQKKIISNVVTFLKPGGYLLFITCSVFKQENEETLDFIKEKFQFQLEKMEVLKGYDKKADTMFAALLRKPL